MVKEYEECNVDFKTNNETYNVPNWQVKMRTVCRKYSKMRVPLKKDRETEKDNSEKPIKKVKEVKMKKDKIADKPKSKTKSIAKK